jgi:ABC-2 type transport system ATP-binding protein
MAPIDTVVEFKDLSKIYRIGFWGKRQEALQRLSLKVPQGKVFGFLGANGAGKTTGIKILMGLQFASHGEVRLWNSPAHLPENKARIGYLPERPYFHEMMTAGEFLSFHRALFGGYLKGKNLKNNAELLQMVGIPDVGAKRLRDFSKGMLQRVGIAQALVNDPDLIILDEPTSGLDPIGRRDVRNLIQSLAKEGKTIFFSSHILSDVETLCHQIAFLEKGILKFQGNVYDILHQKSRPQEIVFHGIAANELKTNAKLGLAEHIGDTSRIVAPSDKDAQDIAQTIWALGGRIVSMQSQHLTLEEALFGQDKNV